jgi:putative thiamine transport system substrate-binding protein
MGRYRSAEGPWHPRLEHVKITDTADVVKRVRAEKAAGRTDRAGTVDLVWINGENFAAMKADGLLFGPLGRAVAQLRQGGHGGQADHAQ